MQKNNKAFTLVELIVVITILAILGTIAFINLSGYSTSARDSKRVSDINNIMKKIGIESSKGTSLSSLITTTKTNSGLTINSQVGSSIQGTANFLILKEDGNSFKDPITNGDYVLSYGVGGTGTGAYKFSQISTVNEELNQAVVKGNYYLMKFGDSPSILKNNNNNFIVNEGVDLPYEIVEGIPVVVNSCDTQPSYINASFTAGTPTSENQIWQNVNNANPCYYECINGYTGSDCSIAPNPLVSCLGQNNPVPFSATTTYSGCDTPDIVVCSGVGAGYVVSACNVGATVAWTGSTSNTNNTYNQTNIFGNYFQWGRNKGFTYIDSSQEPLTITGSIGLNSISDSYGFVWNGSLPSPYTWANTSIVNNWGSTTDSPLGTNISARQGPCASGYHVPSNTEWSGIVTAGGWIGNGTNMQTSLKLPYTGQRRWYGTGFNYVSTQGFYWSSSPNGNDAYALNFYSAASSVLNNIRHAFGLSVRCFKN